MGLGALAGVLIAFAATEAAGAKQGCSRACAERVAARWCAEGRVGACVLRASLRYRVSHQLMRGIVRCESGWNQFAINANGGNRSVDMSVWASDRSTGLMQFKPSTFAGTGVYRTLARLHGRERAMRAIFEARWNAMAGGWLLARAGTSPWLASRHCWG